MREPGLDPATRRNARHGLAPHSGINSSRDPAGRAGRSCLETRALARHLLTQPWLFRNWWSVRHRTVPGDRAYARNEAVDNRQLTSAVYFFFVAARMLSTRFGYLRPARFARSFGPCDRSRKARTRVRFFPLSCGYASGGGERCALRCSLLTHVMEGNKLRREVLRLYCSIRFAEGLHVEGVPFCRARTAVSLYHWGGRTAGRPGSRFRGRPML
jgi:hypothetical protein